MIAKPHLVIVRGRSIRAVAMVLALSAAAFFESGCVTSSAYGSPAAVVHSYGIVAVDDRGVLSGPELDKIQIGLVQYLFSQGYIQTGQTLTMDNARADVVFQVAIKWEGANNRYTVVGVTRIYRGMASAAGPGESLPPAVAGVDPYDGWGYDDGYYDYPDFGGYGYEPYWPYYGFAPVFPFLGYSYYHRAGHRDHDARNHRPPFRDDRDRRSHGWNPGDRNRPPMLPRRDWDRRLPPRAHSGWQTTTPGWRPSGVSPAPHQHPGRPGPGRTPIPQGAGRTPPRPSFDPRPAPDPAVHARPVDGGHRTPPPTQSMVRPGVQNRGVHSPAPRSDTVRRSPAPRHDARPATPSPGPRLQDSHARQAGPPPATTTVRRSPEPRHELERRPSGPSSESMRRNAVSDSRPAPVARPSRAPDTSRSSSQSSRSSDQHDDRDNGSNRRTR